LAHADPTLKRRPQIPQATGNAVQVTVVDAAGKALADASVEVSMAGGSPLAGYKIEKASWLFKDAPDKFTVTVRNGPEVGTIVLSRPAGAGDLVSVVISVDGSSLTAKFMDDTPAAPLLETKPDLSNARRSPLSHFGDIDLSQQPGKLPNPATSTRSTKNVSQLAVPANDNCADAVAVGSLPVSVMGSNVDATDDIPTGFACGVSSGPHKNIWYTVVGTGETITVSTCNTGTDNGSGNFDTRLSVFCNDCSDRICVVGNDDSCSSGGAYRSTVSFCSELGRTYLVTVGGYSPATVPGTIQLDVSSSGTACSNPSSCQRPANDTCAGATPVGTLPASVVGNNGGALNNTPSPPCGFTSTMHKDLWYSVVGNGSTLTVSTCNAGSIVSDTKVSVFCADCANPACVGGDDDSCGADFGTFKSIFSFCSEVGRTYYIAVGNYSASTTPGNIQLDVSSGAACATPPSCGPPLGACCESGVCTGTVEQASCMGTWFTGQTCPAYACPAGCPGETCATPAAIASVPFSGTGNTCDCTNDYDSACPYTGGTASDTVYSYTPSADQCVDITLCNGSAYDTKLYVYQNDCAASAIACNDDSCPNYVSKLTGVNLVAGNTYYIVVDGYGTACGNYVLDITQCAGACNVTCAPGATPEGEADCASVNGGCNSTPPVFSSIACGEDVCGTASWDGTNRDTDWYQIVVANPTEFTWTVEAEFDVVIGLVLTSPPGNPDCATATALDPFAVAGSCTPTSVTVCLQPGTYWWFVAPDFNGPTFACGAEYKARLDCVGCAPPTCTGDTCASAQVVASVPFNGTGDTCICNNDYDETCPYSGSTSPDLVYSYTPAADECVNITLCNGSAYDTKLYVYENTCPSLIACNDDSCPGYVSELTNVNLIGGNTYYIVIDGYGGACGNYVIDIAPCPPPCDVTCAPGDTPENEANCGIPDDPINGGCNTDPVNPPTSPVACGQEYCGTGAFDGSLRDTDWYEITIASSTRFTWTVNGEFDSLMGLIETSPAGSADCADGTGYINPAGFPIDCIPGSVITECLPAGTYRFFVAPIFGDLVTCGKEYTARLDCEACTIPLGACCRRTGACDDGVAEAQCVLPDTWQGVGVLCSGVSCPQPPANDKCPGTKVNCGDTMIGQTTVLAGNDYNDAGTCTGYNQPGADVAYEFALLYDGDVTVTVQNVAGFDPAFYVLTSCANPTACIAGADAGFTGDPETATFTATAGTYYIIVDTYSATGVGTFDLVVTCVQSLEGACCTGGGCVVDSQLGCLAMGGTYAGDGTNCAGSGAGGGGDCNSNGLIDKCDLVNGAPDCQPNGIPDACDVPPIGTEADCQGDGIPDVCQFGGLKTIVINEGFEGTVPPATWTAVVNNAFTWTADTNAPYEGAQNANCLYDDQLGTQDEWLITPSLSMSGTVTLNGYSMGSVYWAITPYDNYDLEAWVVIGPNVNDGDDILIGQIDTDTWVTTWAWTPFTYNFTAPGSAFRIGFRYHGMDGAQAGLDIVTVDGQTGPPPNDCNSNGVPDECDAPTCGNNCLEGGVGSPAEQCDGTQDTACPGQCYPPGHQCECQCPPCAVCGNGIVEPGEECDGGDCCTATCTFEPDTTVCRASTGSCDPAEACTGTSVTCPDDVVITACLNGDGCCPAGCNGYDDNDCPLPTGACCDTLNGVCSEGILEADCVGDQRVWTMDAMCAEVVCDPALGACCDQDVFGTCTMTTVMECDCNKCVWHKLLTCAQIECSHAAIPTVSQWGLVVLTLLLLTGAKVYFGRRPTSAING
jgi:hypothetical protein